MNRGAGFLLAGFLAGCGARASLEVIPGPELDASLRVADAEPEATVDVQEEPEDFHCDGYDNQAPPSLECTGLYARWSTKVLAPGVRPYAPATALWSDGAEKFRWIYLPPETTIDASSRGDWVFPVGTKFWKEFRLGGKRIETRLFSKLRSDRWVTAAYAWSADDSATTSSMGGDHGDFDLGSGLHYHIATQKECSDCHKGRQDRILGFEEVLLGTPGATGLTLSALMAEGLLRPPPPAEHLQIPDDGTNAAAPAVAWIHVNCGITCHNRTSASTGNGTRMYLRLDPTDFGTRPAAEWDLFDTTMRVTTITPGWLGETRIVPGSPERSLLVRLVSSRGTEQMPPIGSHLVDQKSVDLVKEWIRRMPAGGPEDGGSTEDATDALPAPFAADR
jgi:hypothetical protein